MATELHYDSENDLMHTRATGRVTLDDLVNHPKAQIEQCPEKGRLLFELLDAREVDGIDASILSLVAHVPKMLGDLRHFKGIRLAILSDEDWVVGQANQLAALFARSSVRICVFRVKPEAMKWLDEQRVLQAAADSSDS